MLIFPAIDLIDGQCVRLTQGDYNQKKPYSNKPIEVAQNFENDGAKFLHIVDLDGAKKGESVNVEVVKRIVKETSLSVHVGGGIRNQQAAEKMFSLGVDRIVIGTSAVENIEFVRELVDTYGSDRIIVSIDARDGVMAIRGWLEDSQKSVDEFLEELKSVGVKTVIYTDINSDGMLDGPNLQALGNVIASGMNVIAAGGISSMKNLEDIERAGAYGAIIGKALYEGYIDCAESVKSFQKDNLTKRIIPCMDINNGRVVKGTNFVDLKDAGDPVELVKKYSELGADELVFLDITATIEKRKTLSVLVQEISENINIPFTVGGGIRSIEDIKLLLNSGADKVSIGSAAIRNPELIQEASREFGAQCIVISVDVKRVEGIWKIYIDGGRTDTDIDAVEFAQQMQNLGAGELLVNSLDRDGTKQGYDIPLLTAIKKSVSIPVIASSGAGCKEDFLEVFKEAHVDAALAASLFHFEEVGIKELKAYLKRNSVTIRL